MRDLTSLEQRFLRRRRLKWLPHGVIGGQNVPTNLTLPAITGTATVGQTLTALTGTWSNAPTSFAYQWSNEGSPIVGATSSTYALQTGDIGPLVTVQVTATNGAGSSAPAVSASAGPVFSNACPVSGVNLSSGGYDLSANCTITGNVTLSGTATLTMTGATLTVAGNVVLSGSAQLIVINGGLKFPQISTDQYLITLNNNATLRLKSSTLVTSGDGAHHTITLNANNTSVADFDDSTMNTNDGSWMLGNFFDSSILAMKNTNNIPTEHYPNDASQTLIVNSTFAGIWLNFIAGSNHTITIPEKDVNGKISLVFGNSTVLDYFVDIKNTSTRIGLNSYPNSTMIVNGNGSPNSARTTFGYYIQDHTAPVTINSLPLSGAYTQTFTGQGRLISLNNVYIGPFTWQVYIRNSNGHVTTFNNCIINEAAAFTNGLLDIIGGQCSWRNWSRLGRVWSLTFPAAHTSGTKALRQRTAAISISMGVPFTETPSPQMALGQSSP